MADVATHKAPNLLGTPSNYGASRTNSPQNLKKKAPTNEASEKAQSHFDGVESQIPETAQKIHNEGTQTTQNGDFEEQTEDGADAITENDEETEAIPAGSVDHNGDVVDDSGKVIGHVNGENASQLEGSMVDQEGDVLDDEGNVIGTAQVDGECLTNVDPKPISEAGEGSQKPTLEGSEKPDLEDDEKLETELGEKDLEGSQAGGSQAPLSEIGVSKKAGTELGGSQLPEGEKPEGTEAELPEGVEKPEGAETELSEGAEVEKPEGAESELPEGADAEVLDLSILEGKKVNKLGKIVDENGNPFGLLVEGEAKKLAGKKVGAEGKIWDDAGKVIGRAELLPENEREAEPSLPFEDFPDSIVDAKGNIIFQGKVVGKLVEGDAKKLDGKKVDADGDILDKNGNVLGKAERCQEEEEIPEAPEEIDLSALEGKKVNKAGNVVDDNGKLFGRVVEGDIPKLVGKKCDAQGKIWSDSGKGIGSAELIPVDDRDEKTGAPFEDFPDAVVDSKGNVMFEGQIVGKLNEGDAKKLAGKKVDVDGEVVDKIGNVLGKAERWAEPDEPEPEAIDLSALAGKRVNKVGNVVDSHGQIYGRLVEGDPKKLAGKMCDNEPTEKSLSFQAIRHAPHQFYVYYKHLIRS